MGWHFHGLDQDDLGKSYDTRLLRRLFNWVRPYRWGFLAAVALMIVVSAGDIVMPLLVGKGAVDGPLKHGDARGLLLYALAAAVVVTVSNLAKGPQVRLQYTIAERVIRDLRRDTFAHLESQSVDFYEKNKIGVLISRMTNDIEAIGNMMREGLSILVVDALQVLGVVSVMFFLSWRLTLAVLVIVPLLALSTMYFRDRARRVYREVRKSIAEVASTLQESISGVRASQSFDRKDENVRRFDRTNFGNFGANVQAAMVSGTFTPIVEAIGALGIAIVIWYGGWQVVHGLFTVGALFTFYLYVQRMKDPLVELSQLYTVLQAGMSGCERIFQILDTPPSVQEAPNARGLNGVAGHIAFEGVTFEYVPGQPVLHDLRLDIPAGQSIALVGPTGAGKTTISSLTARLYDPTHGRVTLDGLDLRDIRFDALRPLMAFVPQEPFLFGGTVRDNIRYGRLDATDDEIETAARAVNAHEGILRLPNGYDTKVEERGGNLSTGQRQLVALARALIADPRILIFDEATSSVDTYTEHRLQRGIRHLLHGRTSLIIAHRLSTVRYVDRIVVLDHGRIAEEGSHADLIARGGMYKTLYDMQFRDLPAAH